MSKYLFIRESDGAPVYGDTKFHVKQPGQYAPDPSDDLSRLTIVDRMNRNESVDLSKPISYFLKEDGSPYANYAELDGAMAGFFFRVANKNNGGVGADGYLLLPNTVTGMNVRIGCRAGYVYAIDQELTATGFAGVENTDWVNVGGITQE